MDIHLREGEVDVVARQFGVDAFVVGVKYVPIVATAHPSAYDEVDAAVGQGVDQYSGFLSHFGFDFVDFGLASFVPSFDGLSHFAAVGKHSAQQSGTFFGNGVVDGGGVDVVGSGGFGALGDDALVAVEEVEDGFAGSVDVVAV